MLALNAAIWFVFAACTLCALAVRPTKQDSTPHGSGISMSAVGQLQLEQATTRRGPTPAPAANLTSKQGEPALGKSQPSKKPEPDARADLCAAAGEVTSKKRIVKDGLSGVHLTVVVPFPGNHFMVKGKDGTWSGYDYEVLKAVANVANFKFDIEEFHYDTFDKTRVNKTVDGFEKLNASANLRLREAQFINLHKRYDIVIEQNGGQANHEERQGIFPVYGMLDTSLVLVTQHGQQDYAQTLPEKLMVVFTPFDKWVWLGIVTYALGTGALYVLLEKAPREVKLEEAAPSAAEATVDKAEADNEEGSSEDVDFSNPKTTALAMWVAMMQSFGLINFAPLTWPGRLLALSWAVTSVMILACFTANLATILTMEAQQGKIWSNLEDAMQAKASICIGGRNSFTQELSRRYDHTVPVWGPPIQEMVAGKCDAAITWYTDYEVSALKHETNPKCELTWIGPRLAIASGGWTSMADYNNKCTSLVHDVLHANLEAMQESGELETLYQDKLLATETTLETPCGATPAPSINDMSLTLQHLIGVFMFHLVGVSIALIAYCVCAGTRSPS